MHAQGDLSPRQLVEFLAAGYLVVPGEFTISMIEELLDALEKPAKIPGSAAGGDFRQRSLST